MVFKGDKRLNMEPSDSATNEAQLTEQPNFPKVDVLSSVHIASSTKDSAHIKWNILQEFAPSIQGFKVRYQAEGSHVIQYSPRLSPRELDYNIHKLHEDTFYEVCVQVYTNMSATRANVECVQASTRTDSLHVALGSAFGAFLALGIIVGFVFLAKWRHNTKRRKRLQKLMAAHNGDVAYSFDVHDPDYAVSDVSMQVNDEQMKLSELGSQLDYCDAREYPGAVAAVPELSDCSEEPHSYNSNSFFSGSNERCCQCEVNLSAESFLNRASPRSMRSARNIRQQSVESSRSLGIPRQQSIGSYGPKRGSLRKQRSMDSSSRRDLNSHRSRDSGLYSFPRQKSQDSDFSDSSPYFDKRSHRCDTRDAHGLRPGNGNKSRSRSPLDGYRSDRGYEAASHSPIAQLFQVTTPQNTPPKHSPVNPFQTRDGRPADVRPKFLSAFADMDPPHQPFASNEHAQNGSSPQPLNLPLTEPRVAPIPVIDIEDSNSLDSGLIASPPESKLEFGSPSNDDNTGAQTNNIPVSSHDYSQNTPQTNMCQNDAFISSGTNTSNKHGSLISPESNGDYDSAKKPEIPPPDTTPSFPHNAGSAQGPAITEKYPLVPTADYTHTGKEPVIPEHYPLISPKDLHCVNDGGHSNGLRHNNSCPNW